MDFGGEETHEQHAGVSAIIRAAPHTPWNDVAKLLNPYELYVLLDSKPSTTFLNPEPLLKPLLP